jgi:hypothetical protein
MNCEYYFVNERVTLNYSANWHGGPSRGDYEVTVIAEGDSDKISEIEKIIENFSNKKN